MTNQFKDNLFLILEELSKYKGRNKDELLNNYVQERLNKSLVLYYNELENKLMHLSLYDESKIMKYLGGTNESNR